jgi:hypothetical protein
MKYKGMHLWSMHAHWVDPSVRKSICFLVLHHLLMRKSHMKSRVWVVWVEMLVEQWWWFVEQLPCTLWPCWSLIPGLSFLSYSKLHKLQLSSLNLYFVGKTETSSNDILNCWSFDDSFVRCSTWARAHNPEVAFQMQIILCCTWHGFTLEIFGTPFWLKASPQSTHIISSHETFQLYKACQTIWLAYVHYKLNYTLLLWVLHKVGEQLCTLPIK